MTPPLGMAVERMQEKGKINPVCMESQPRPSLSQILGEGLPLHIQDLNIIPVPQARKGTIQF